MPSGGSHLRSSTTAISAYVSSCGTVEASSGPLLVDLGVCQLKVASPAAGKGPYSGVRLTLVSMHPHSEGPTYTWSNSDPRNSPHCMA
jgi:hypothetical protein